MSGRKTPPGSPATEFSAAPFDAIDDLYGDPLTADLNVLFAGNQFMVLPDLFALFRREHPLIKSIFYETLPPGIVVAQLRSGRLRVGTLELSVVPDVIAASPAALAGLESDGLIHPPVAYATNDLALLVPAGNPACVRELADLARPGVRVAMPDPRTEGIGTLAMDALTELGASIHRQVSADKVASGQVLMTTIHHRQSPAWLRDGTVDVAVMWQTEASFHLAAGAPFEIIDIDSAHNRTGDYAAATCTAAHHPAAANAFLEFICGPVGQSVYAHHGFAAAQALAPSNSVTLPAQQTENGRARR